jgi:signal transduction histidine kinase
MSDEHKGRVARAKAERLGATTEGALHALDPASIGGEDLLRRVLDGLQGMVYRCKPDVDRTMEFVSLGCRTLTGFEAGDFVARRKPSYAQLIHADDAARVLHRVAESVRAGEPFSVAYRIRRVDGREVRVLDMGCPVRGPSGGVAAIEGLVTRCDGLLEGASEVGLDRIRRGASELAHDLNNVFATIQTTAELLRLESRDPAVVADLIAIVDAAIRGSELARKLSRLGALPTPEPS